jgi:uncharacterized protein (TIGR02594 family)
VIRSPFELAQRFIGVKEIPGTKHNPQVLAMLKLDAEWPEGDEVPWCSAFVNYVAWLCRLPRSKSLRARSWLQVGELIQLEDARPGFDLVIFARGDSAIDPELIDAPGHVGFFAGFDALTNDVAVLGGNQGNAVSVALYDLDKLLGVRRIGTPPDDLA